MEKKIYKFLNKVEEYAPIIAKEIVEQFVENANEHNVDYSFTISRKDGKIREGDADPNTYFVFDTETETSIDEFKKSLFDEDLSYIEEHSKEEEVLMDDVRQFLLRVCQIISNDYKSILQKTIRRVVLGNKSDEQRVPLSKVDVVSIDIADYSSFPESSKYMLKIGKIPGSDINTDEVIRFVQSRQEKTGMDIETIFSIEKKAGNPLFKNVEAVILGKKFLNEISIYFFVDYTVVPFPKIEEAAT